MLAECFNDDRAKFRQDQDPTMILKKKEVRLSEQQSSEKMASERQVRADERELSNITLLRSETVSAKYWQNLRHNIILFPPHFSFSLFQISNRCPGFSK